MIRDMSARIYRFAACLLAAASMSAAVQAASAQEAPKNFVRLDTPKSVAEITFDDAEGHTRKLADFKGKVLLLNVWASWCVPCRKEMPALDRLQAKLGGAAFEVIPVSIDRGGVATVRKFYNEIGIRDLAMYVDPSGEVLRQTSAVGLPTTLFIARSGREVGRVIGPAEWDTPEVAEFLKPLIVNGTLAAEQANRGNSQPAHGSQDAPGLLTRSINWLRTLMTK